MSVGANSWIRAARPGRDVIVDALFAVGLSGALVVAVAVDTGDEHAQAPDARAYLMAIALGGFTLVRRRWPIAVMMLTMIVLGAYYVLGYPSIGVAVPTAAALYTVAESGRLRVAITAACGVLAISITAQMVEGDESIGFVVGYDSVIVGALLMAFVALGDAVRSRRRWQAEVAHRAERAAIEGEREATRRVAEERLRIARDLHDVLGHTMSVITMQADLTAEVLDEDPGAAGPSVAVIRQASRDAMRELRATVGLLRADSDGASPRQPVPSLAQVDRLAVAAGVDGLDVTVDTTGLPQPLSAMVEATAHHIVQEAITNVVRHAEASHAQVHLRFGPRHLVLEVADDGVGARGRTGTGEGFGIQGMCERAAAVGGGLVAANGSTGGFRVVAWLPHDGVP